VTKRHGTRTTTIIESVEIDASASDAEDFAMLAFGGR
jgi:hypothetical protein